MHPSRRDMLRGGAALAAAPLAPRVSGANYQYFAPHPFIEQNPKAVFIRRTHVPHRKHRTAIQVRLHRKSRLQTHGDPAAFAGGFQFRFGAANTSNGGLVASPFGELFGANGPSLRVNKLADTVLVFIPAFHARAFTVVVRSTTNGPS